MSWVAVAVGGSAIVDAAVQNSASNKAANAQKSAANAAIAQSEQNYNRTEQNLSPYIGAGTNALTGLEALNSGNYSGFENSPDYQFALSQGLQGLDRSAAAKGSLGSGGHSADILNYASGLASQNLNAYRNSLTGLAQMGQNAASNLGSVGTGNAASIGGYLTNAGNAQATSAINQGNQWANVGNQLANLAGQYAQSNTASSYTPTQNYAGTGSLSTYWPGQTNTNLLGYS